MRTLSVRRIQMSAVGEAIGERAAILRSSRFLFNNAVLALADQALISAMSFGIVLLLGNWADLQQVGVYVICSSIILLFFAAQEALVTRPYTIQHRSMAAQAGSYAFGALALAACVAVGAALLIGITAVVLSVLRIGGDVVPLVWTLAWVTPISVMREFARRFAFAHLKMHSALLLDLIVIGCTALGLIGIASLQILSAANVLSVIGISCSVGVLVWIWFSRGSFDFTSRKIGANLSHSWSLGKWLFSSKIALQVQGYSTHWLSMAVAGPLATGIFAACSSMVAFANPIVFGFINFMGPKSAQAFSVDGNRGVRSQALLDTAVMVITMAVFCALLVQFGDAAMRSLFPAAAGYGDVLIVLGFAAMAGAMGVPATTALSSAGQTRAVAAATVTAAVLNVGLVWWFLLSWGLLGAALATLVAGTAGSVLRWAAFLLLVPVEPKPAPRAERARSTGRVQRVTVERLMRRLLQGAHKPGFGGIFTRPRSGHPYSR